MITISNHGEKKPVLNIFIRKLNGKPIINELLKFILSLKNMAYPKP